ncbi:MAG: 3'-5' exonuclease [Clostridia bacterium]|nr:3'-5' exonuclease [Clostridia bacterium]
MENILEKLNPSQLEAVTALEGYIRVIAGAGSGKTKALTHRFAYLVNEVGVLPGNILCVTFTNKAANEMRQRIHQLTGDNDTGYINTFHGFCVNILQEDSFAVSYPKNFLVLDNSDIDDMLGLVYEERGLTLRDMTYRDARDMIENQKLCEKPEYYLDLINMSLEDLHKKYLSAEDTKDIIFYGYLYQEKKCFGLDYNDLIKFVLYIFSQNKDIKRKWQQRLEYIMVDEFQDIDSLQYKLMKVLCGYHHNLFVVGDPDQIIYTWRGANIKYIMDFDKEFPNVKTIMMMDNYRSTPQIISVANSLIDKNKHRIKKDLIPTLPDGEKVICHFADTAENEAKWIAGKITELNDSGVPLKDMTILYRSHFVTRELENNLRKAKIPYSIYGGVQFYDRQEIKNTLAYLRMVIYKDDLSFRRIVNVPKRNIGERRIKHIEEYAIKNNYTLYQAMCQTVDDDIFKGTKAREFISIIEELSANCNNRLISELLSEVLDKSGYEKALRTEGSQDRLDNLAELKQSVFDYETTCGEESTPEHYLAHIALYTDKDRNDKGDKVKLMTVHSAKGLEFPCVFLCGMNEGIFPSRRTNTSERMEEERRLAFVAVTRAEKQLFITESEGRNSDGSPRYPSRFILDIDEELLEFTHKPKEELIKEAREYFKATEKYLPDNFEEDIFAVGTRVRHSILGVGTVLDFDKNKLAYLIKFDDIGTARKISFRVKLNKVEG